MARLQATSQVVVYFHVDLGTYVLGRRGCSSDALILSDLY